MYVHPPFIEELSESDIIKGTMMISLVGGFFLLEKSIRYNSPLHPRIVSLRYDSVTIYNNRYPMLKGEYKDVEKMAFRYAGSDPVHDRSGRVHQ